MNSKEYVENCSAKAGKGKNIILAETQTTTLQGLVAGSIETGKILAMLKKDIFEYSKIKIEGEINVDERVAPLLINETSYVALRSILGMNGEMADITETVYRFVKDQGVLEIDKLKEDLGDWLFYASVLLSIIGSDWQEIQELNQAKTDRRDSINKQP